MKKFERLMICLDGTEKDAIVLQHLALLKHNLNIKTIYFFHVIKRSLVPESISRLFSDYQEEGKEVEKSIIELIKNEWAFSTLHYEVVIEKGRLLEKTLQAIKKYNIDLLLLGRNTEDNLDYTNQKIASLAHCSVLFIPHVRSDKYHKIVVPIDFSENSKIALRRVLWQKERNPNLEILPVHCYRVPSGYSKSGKTYREFAELMRQHAEQEFAKLQQETETGQLKCQYFLVKSKKYVPRKIFEYSISRKADFLIMGARGRTEFASYFLGSNAIKLLEECHHLPILMEKDEKSIILLNKFLE